MRRFVGMLVGLALLVTTLHAATYVKFEAISVTTAPVGFTAANIQLTATHLAATDAMCVVSTAGINYTVDPTTTVTSATGGGIPVAVGSTIVLSNPDVLANFSAVSQTATTAMLSCTYSRP